jgi:transcriptional regulator with XRE-family HTH domain
MKHLPRNTYGEQEDRRVNLDDAHIGRRVREVRTWRGQSIAAVAGLAGISAPYLSMIENGQRPVTKYALLESLARALRVSPTELTGKPYPPTDPVSNQSHAAVAAIENVVNGWRIGEIPDGPTRPWPAIQADLDLLNATLRPRADYAAETVLLPHLIRDLLVAVAKPDLRRPALTGLIAAYSAAGAVTRLLGFPGLQMVTMEHMRHAAEELNDPVWCAEVAWERAQAMNGINRTRQYQLAVAVADGAIGMRPEIGGMANLTAALSAAAQGNADIAATHLVEAAALAEQMDTDVSPWAHTHFGRTNVGIWSMAIAVELGNGGRVAEIAPTIRLGDIALSRQVWFFIDYARGLISERKTRDRGLTALLKAESLAPQQFRNNSFAREAVASLLHTARREAGGRELRGLAWRMGVAPTG